MNFWTFADRNIVAIVWIVGLLALAAVSVWGKGGDGCRVRMGTEAPHGGAGGGAP